ncbi:flagellar brake protein [Halalkalibacter nanhaiisediminis]|uniref:C-di-GMP-binding flagellar brake protein YcgR n=1 Tax=Halalkalibacter nanhaiisediminis TaxID=688079 RepID=A0A562QQ62_9BACI|nr:flagellar brake domain-containing protein [Halalkalibacter nanhaiisediminis]TWI58835.1 c-di-GMP-binding flagellar brake protein YcgR [Halalkalibacter nanhaiisediminis]
MIEIGSTIFLEINDTKEEKEKILHFRCRLVDRDKDIFLIDYPINQETDKPSFFFDGTEFRAWFMGKDEAVYAFDTEIVGRRKSNIPMLMLKDPGKERYMRIQRRDYVRVEATVDAALHPLNQEFSPFTSVSIDLSGGGCAVVIPHGKSLPKQGKLMIWLVLPMQTGDLSYVKAACKIIRVFKNRPGARERVSLQFLNIEEHERQKIIRYCFERQLILRRKQQELM